MTKIQLKPEGTYLSRLVKYNQIYGNFFIKIIFIIIWIIGIASVAITILQMLALFGSSLYQLEITDSQFGWSVIMLAVFLTYLALRAFNLDRIKIPQKLSLVEIKAAGAQKTNLFEAFSFSLAFATENILNQKNIDAGLFVRAIIESRDMTFILGRIGLSQSDLASRLKGYKSEKLDIPTIIAESLDIAIAENHRNIEVGDVFVALCDKEPYFKSILTDLKLEAKDIANVVYWQSKIEKESGDDRRIFDPNVFKFTGGIGRDWAFGWTPFLKQFSSDISKEIQAQGLNMEIIGHENEINQIKEALLRQNGANAVLVGDPGIGKRSTVLGFVKKVIEGDTKTSLDFKHVMKLDVDTMISGLSSPGELTERISGVMSEAQAAGNLIIYIENFERLLSSGDAGQIDASAVLLPFLEAAEMHIIATCDTGSYNRFVAPNTVLTERFSVVNISEPNQAEMIRILEDTLPIIETKTKSIVSYEAILETVKMADRYIVNIPNPEKSINLLDESVTHAFEMKGQTIVLASDISGYVTEKYNVPAGDAEKNEKEKLLNLEEIMHKRIIGQNEAIDAISNAMRRARAGVVSSKKPIGSFLFLGPTGVGKTETAKALAEAYFGNESAMVRFDMSEFQNKEDIYRFIGSTNSSDPGILTTAVRENPFSLLLFDEVEKACKEILDLFLQILDEGFITDGTGHKVIFTNTIIITTSNAGANMIRESIKSGADYEKVRLSLLDYLQKSNIYRPEFLNRFTSVIAFSPLSQDQILQIANLMIEKLKTDLAKEKKVTVTVEPDAVAQLAQLGFDPTMGARPMERVIQEKLENLLAKKILSGKLEKGQTFNITKSDIA